MDLLWLLGCVSYTNIIEEGRIAYLAVNTFMHIHQRDLNIIFNFYEKVADYEHLIIDIRNNHGGWATNVHEIIGLLFIENTNINTYVFSMNGIYSEIVNRILRTPPENMLTRTMQFASATGELIDFEANLIQNSPNFNDITRVIHIPNLYLQVVLCLWKEI